MKLFKKKINKPIVYTMNNCDYCKKVLEEFEKSNVSFIEKDINLERECWENTVSITNVPTTPTIFYNNTYLCPTRDFVNPTQLINMLKSLKENDINHQMLMLERIKTLNFNTSRAFNALQESVQQLLKNTGGYNTNETKIKKDEHKSTN